MGIELFSLWIDSDCVAKEMSIETAAVLMKALFNNYYNESDLKITIQRQNYEPVVDGREFYSEDLYQGE